MTARNPLLLPLCGMVAGILSAKFFRFYPLELALTAIGFALLWALALWKTRRVALLPCLGLIGVAGVFTAEFHRPSPPPKLNIEDNETVLLSGCIAEVPSYAGDRVRFALEFDRGARARVTLSFRPNEAEPRLYYGQQVEIEARVRSPRNFGNPGAFDYVGYLARRDVYWLASARGSDKVKLLPGSCGPSWSMASFRTWEYLASQIDKLYGVETYEASMMRGMLLGDSSGIQKIWTEHFRRTGTYHALVISGLHITVLAGTVLALFRWIALPFGLRLILAGLLACGYSFLTGMQAPVVRAAGGFVLFLIAQYFYRRGRVLNILAAVAIVYLVIDPGQLFEASFQLSFLAVAAIGALATPLLEKSSFGWLSATRAINESVRDTALSPRVAQFRVELRLLAETLQYLLRLPQAWTASVLAIGVKWVLAVFELVLVSAAVQIGLLLPMIFYFHRVSLTSLSANAIVVPLTTPIVPLGFLAMLTGWSWPAEITVALLHWTRNVVDWHAQWEPAWRIPDPPLWLALSLALVIAAICFAAICFAAQRAKFIPAVAFAGCFFFVIPSPAPELIPGQFECTAIDVGQGDSLLLVFPDGKTMLLDGGGIPSFDPKYKPRLEIGEDVVSPYLWSRGIHRLDVVAMTHAHDDHARGLIAIIENFQPRELWTGVTPHSAVWSELQTQARRFSTRIVPLFQGDRRNQGGVSIQVLAPYRDYEAGAAPKNNDSLVLQLVYGRHRFLLTGDMERQVEARLVADGSLEQVDVLKVGHHGSKSSSTRPFLEAVSPLFALISAGAYNSYNHPHPEVLERLSAMGTRAIGTHVSGLTTIRSDGKRLSLESHGLEGARQAVFAPE